VERARGFYRRCRKWRFPADAALGLPAEGTQSPAVQEIAALTVSKMPAAEAEQVVERLVGTKISAASLSRQARQQGQRAQEKRAALDRQMSGPAGLAQQDRDLQMQLPLEPFTLVIELDAWNIRERDGWGRSAEKRAHGEEPPRWHWVYGGTCFRLGHRGVSASGRATIVSRGYVMTRGGLEALREQLWAEASRRGLGRANEVLIVADGAVWIWNLATDRFPGVRQRDGVTVAVGRTARPPLPSLLAQGFAHGGGGEAEAFALRDALVFFQRPGVLQDIAVELAGFAHQLAAGALGGRPLHAAHVGLAAHDEAALVVRVVFVDEPVDVAAKRGEGGVEYGLGHCEVGLRAGE